jgi:hypothetical protein
MEPHTQVPFVTGQSDQIVAADLAVVALRWLVLWIIHVLG